MQNIWFPAPVFVFFRRIVNVVSAFSVSQQYLLHQKSSDKPQNEPQPKLWGLSAFRTWDQWMSWANSPRLSLASQAEEHFHDPPRLPPSNGPSPPRAQPQPRKPPPQDKLHALLEHPALFDPARKPRYPIVLCHGLYGFDVRGPALFRTHYWANVLSILRQKVGAEVIVTGVPSTGSITSRAESLDRLLQNRAAGRGVNLMAHSMGGLDCRHLISRIKPTDYTPVSLTTIGTPHRGSPFMDWCTDNLGLGRITEREKGLTSANPVPPLAHSQAMPNNSDAPQQSEPDTKPALQLSLSSLPSSFTTLLLSLFDSPAYANLSTSYLNDIFNPSTPDDPNVKYFSIAGRVSSLNIWHPLWLPKMVLEGFEEKERENGRVLSSALSEHERWGNDGLVTVQSARWGEFLGILEESDHWQLRGAKGVEIEVDFSSVSVPGFSSGEGWSLGDWGKFVVAWKREEKAAKDIGGAVSDTRGTRSSCEARRSKTAVLDAVPQLAAGRDFADEVVKASTDQLSAVFDWIIEQVPSGSSSSPTSTSSPTSFGGIPAARSEERKATQSDLHSKADLERFYVALCKKLYDEGL